MARRKIIKNPVGRPEHVPDRKTRQIVERCIACGMSHEDTARAIGISWKTLDKYYADELKNGPARKRREVINMLFASAKAGNVSAQRKLVAMVGGDPEVPVADAEAPRKKLGKKEQVQAAAERVSDKYAPPAPPKLVVVHSK